ncbi:MAG: alpha/beta hydrolase [Anaerolineae bacterium]|nr:alpha/beta hydrolase [Anaerolineae bacterium]
MIVFETEARTKPYKSYRITTGRVRLNVLDWDSNSTEPPILFLHAFTANGLASLTFGKLLNGRRRLLAPDLRGRGRSDMPAGEYGLLTHLNDLIGLMDRLRLVRFVVLGHSFGATLSLFMAAKYPERVSGLILVDGGALPGEEAQQSLAAYYGNLTYRYPSAEQYVSRFQAAPLYQPWTPELETLVRSNLRQQPDDTFIRNVPRYVVEADRRREDNAMWEQLPSLYRDVRCPVLILRAGQGVIGKEDQVLPDPVISQMQAGMPAAKVVTIESAGHTSVITIPSEERDQALSQFLGLNDER